MTHKAFYISDTHFSHEKAWSTFKRNDGSPLRDFSSTEEMDETIIENWNKVVRPIDHVYHLGDVTINRKNLWILSRLNGKKTLVRGNHDLWNVNDFLPYFDDVHGVYVDTKRGWVLSHVPLHPESLGRWNRNVHGHLHANRVTLDSEIDPRYFNVSVEQIEYTPIEAEELHQRFINQGWIRA